MLSRNSLKVSLLFAALLVASPAFASRRKESVASSMKQLSARIIEAYEAKDVDRLKSYYAKQPDALYFWERKMSYTWDSISQTMDALTDAAARISLRLTDFRSGGAGRIGWFAATFHIERIAKDGKKSESDGRWTIVAERSGKRWLIVHEHTSFPLPKR